MILYFQNKLLKSVYFGFLSFSIITISAAFTYPFQSMDFNRKNDYYENKAAKTLGDSIDLVLKKVEQSLGITDVDLTLGVIKDGQVFLKKNYGYSNPETKTLFSDRSQIYLASASKSLTGTLAAILDQKGMIKLNKSIADYFPELIFDDKNIHPEKITIQSLITHTHGIKNNDVVVWTAFIGHKGTAHILGLLKKYSIPLPNQNFNYSNLGPVIYSLIVEKQMEKPWQEVMSEYLFKPLGMHSTTAYFSKVNTKYVSNVIDKSEGNVQAILDKADNSMSAAGGHFSTVNDLLKYLDFFISEGNSVKSILTKQEINFASSAIVPQQNRYQSYERYGYGLGWEQSKFNGENLTSRMGGYSGISCHLSYLKDQKIGIVVLSNKKGMEALSHLVANYLYNTMLNKSNKNSVLEENLKSLKRNFDSDLQETKEVNEAKAAKIAIDQALIGSYDGGEKSGSMQITTGGKVSWGNLKGKLHLLTDSTGLINFQTMLRSFSVKRESNGTIAGVYSNERYFKR
ncbi:serine hydrolase domain-containing protein [Pedobacter roseus]|uniref:Serine hydrolase n=1 Tax=Pedobacter roseus TaxID=336820 RepID=A0A7G9QHH6_9SPHI|nr:serine hydrolase domain-containing protein [Pedobacter roseus]QNN42801.1 serine hydrolase [Pedobacter roseus]